MTAKASLLAQRLQLGIGLLLLCPSARALPAEACGSAERPFVQVVFLAGPDQERLKGAMLRDLRAGLEPSKIDVCRSGSVSAAAPVAVLNCVFSDSSDGLRVSLEVLDPVTMERIARDIQLDALPADGRSLALAVESEELLRASWAKPRPVAVASAEKGARPERKPDAHLPRASRRDRRFVIGARAAAAHYGGDQTQLGGDAVTLLRLPRRFWLEIAFGWRRMVETNAPTWHDHRVRGQRGSRAPRALASARRFGI